MKDSALNHIESGRQTGAEGALEVHLSEVDILTNNISDEALEASSRSYEIAFLFEKSPTATASRFDLAFETFNRATMTAGIFARRPRRLTRLNVWNFGGIDEIL
jgi:hypothetical protein